MASFAKWLFSQSTSSYDEKLAALFALNNMSSTAALSSESVVTIGVVKKICGTIPCDRRLVTLAERFKTSVRQLLEHNHRYSTHFQFCILDKLKFALSGLLMWRGNILMFKCHCLPKFHLQVTEHQCKRVNVVTHAQVNGHLL
jgi:hypothetical protein